jgi:hypothetical protein
MSIKRVEAVYLLKWDLRSVAGEATVDAFASQVGVRTG